MISLAVSPQEILRRSTPFLLRMAGPVRFVGGLLTQTPMQILEREHGVTRRMLTLLERLTAHVEIDAGFPAADVATVLSFFREFVELEHHAKEDLAIYPLALVHGDDRDAELVGRLVAEHDETKQLLHSLTLFWEPDDLLPEEREGFVELARTYVRRLERHMRLEERRLFPYARRMDAEETERVLASFESIDARGTLGLERWCAVAAELEARWAS